MVSKLFNSEIKHRSYYTGSRDEMLRFIPQFAHRILEVGCAAGGFGSILKSKRNVEVWGVEICENVAEEAKRKLDKVIIGDFENNNLPIPTEYFDCIIFNDVLEHFINPWFALKKTKKCLRNNGCVVASIPNVRYFFNIKRLLKYKEWNYTEYGILDSTHLRFFTIKSIETMFQACGFDVIRIEGLKPIEFPWKFRIINRFLKNTFDDMRFMQFACVAQKQIKFINEY